MRKYICIVGLFLATCSGRPDVHYADLPPAALHPQGNVAQFVFYYPDSFFREKDVAEIDLGGQRACGLKSGTFLIRNIPPSPYTAIAVAPCGRPGWAHLAIQTTANMRYYIRVVPSDDTTLSGRIARSSLARPVLQNTLPWHSPTTGGAYTIDIMDEASAMKEMQSLKECAGCF